MNPINNAVVVAFLFFFFATSSGNAQDITIQPYLQDVTPNSAYILWETNQTNESVVEWGTSNELGNVSYGTSFSSNTSRLHQVQLENLSHYTRYYYRVKTGSAVSAIFEFKTPPLAADEKPFRIVAMSDMQKDGDHPNKFKEIVEEGVLKYFKTKYGGKITDNLALLMLPGDLVSNGEIFSQWKNDFFNPAEKLYSQIPVYPVLGNHENNSANYFNYFKLPENGTEGYREHWWFKDYGNLRIIGLNSNTPYSGNTQLAWLQQTLNNTLTADSIDFVFAQMHHPYKSELWTPGESDFTGSVIEKLDNFAAQSGKPVVHLFGHTHGYSRGQSRDQKHLWVNVATAGGAIDNWSEFPNNDYNEFSVSQDEYGFIVIDVTDGNDPKLVLRRISRGDQDQVVENQQTDVVTIRKNASIVNKPEGVSPANQKLIPECVVLKADNFSSANTSAEHAQSHWQVSTSATDFSNPAADSWKTFENWYNEVNTQEGDDLTDEPIAGLSENTNYWWRVRYRDKELNWSEWSEPLAFSTGKSQSLPNLLKNPGAENGLESWQTIQGVVEALAEGECDGISPYNGQKYFIVGGLCNSSAVAKASQYVDVSSFADSVKTGNFNVNYGGYLSNYNGSDRPELKVIFYDSNNQKISEGSTLSTLNSNWTLLSATMHIPQHTKTIKFELKGTRNAGSDNDSYFDDLFLTVGSAKVDCSVVTSVNGAIRPFIPELQVVPNPMVCQSYIQLPGTDYSGLKLSLADVNGCKLSCRYRVEANRIVVERDSLVPGFYMFIVRDKRTIRGKGKIIISD
ncbi:metallophosphoesterase family protein [Maribellus sp. CM-23]|uniref:purple acid phosphatase family protein n=1 Tax=Maribellus sp. CM-23 TaxID=2781026 RepID=UPI001F176DF9|nr:metallophosphoesterase family protein [Maribellus sp. CM-23]MCE4564758.1 metallophosphoesterase family protein [Maribellus sp. CM-23]